MGIKVICLLLVFGIILILWFVLGLATFGVLWCVDQFWVFQMQILFSIISWSHFLFIHVSHCVYRPQPIKLFVLANAMEKDTASSNTEGNADNSISREDLLRSKFEDLRSKLDEIQRLSFVVSSGNGRDEEATRSLSNNEIIDNHSNRGRVDRNDSNGEAGGCLEHSQGDTSSQTTALSDDNQQ